MPTVVNIGRTRRSVQAGSASRTVPPMSIALAEAGIPLGSVAAPVLSSKRIDATSASWSPLQRMAFQSLQEVYSRSASWLRRAQDAPAISADNASAQRLKTASL